MLKNSTALKRMLDKFVDEQNKRDAIKNSIDRYETDIAKRISLQDIVKIKERYEEHLNNSIDLIEKADIMLGWLEQLRLSVRTKNDSINKQYELQKIAVNSQMEFLEAIKSCVTKTEKEEAKKKYMKEQLINLELEKDDIKTDLEFIDTLINDATRTREKVYAYYQGVKKIGGII